MKTLELSLLFTTLLWLSLTSTVKSQITSKPISYKSLADTNTALLSDLSGSNLTLDDIKRQHAGKIIFLEYWASWCAPCRELMPKSEHIRENVKDMNVAYIYLSLDSDEAKWAKASQEEKIDQYAYNYRILNVKTSEFIKKYNVGFIPQAMVLGKYGTVLKTQLYPGSETLIPYLTKLSKD